MIGDYNREEETIKGYNGRQILELLQNCDDEGSKEVLITLDKIKKQVSIHNLGTPFSEKGYRSLFIANLSSKTDKVRYIGNKGLGFRSIINWSTAIEIQSNNLALIYSEKRKKENLNKLFSQNEIKKIFDNEGFSKKKVPIPFLTLPKIKEIAPKKYVTSIIIDYKKEFEKDIIRQINEISPETILFLNHINEIKFEGFQKGKGFKCERKNIKTEASAFKPKSEVSFNNGNLWDVFELEGVLPKSYSEKDSEERERYQIKIAIERELKASSPYLFSFFPTKIKLKQDYILHATFDLDSTRNQINDSKKNRFILTKVVEFTAGVAKYFCRGEVSYKPLQILNHDSCADTLESLGYYEKISEYIHSEKIFPCVDNTYKKYIDCVHLSDNFAEFLQRTNTQNIIECHLIPFKDFDIDKINLYPYLDDCLSVFPNSIEILNYIGENIESIKERAFFISLIIKNCEFILQEKKYHHKLNLLLNKKSELINSSEYVYTPVSKEKEVKVPNFTKIEFINVELFKEICVYLGFNSEDHSSKSRFIVKKLSCFFNIHNYSAVTVANKIISQTNELIGNSNNNQLEEIVKELHSCLFANYLAMDENMDLKLKGKVPVIDLNGNIKLSGELVFSSFYNRGVIVERIFENIYKKDKYLGSPELNGLKKDKLLEDEKLGYYFKWLGVNDFAIYTKREYNINNLHTFLPLLNYKKFLENELEKTIDDRIDAELLTIENLTDIIQNISLEKLIAWAAKDSKLKQQLNDDENIDQFSFFYRVNNTIQRKPSYIKYKIISESKHNISSLLIQEKFSWLNSTKVNYEDPVLKEFNITKSEVDFILVKLGAKDNFNDLSIERVTKIINDIPLLHPNGHKSQVIYKAALSHFKDNGQELTSDVKLFANSNNRTELFSQSDIYFSDRIKLPKQLRRLYPVFNFPVRAGGAEAIKFFKINDLSEIKIKIDRFIINEELSADFDYHLSQIKPLVLTHRLNTIEEDEQQKIQASICNKLKIILCEELTYSVAGNLIKSKDFEFVVEEKNTFYVSIRTLGNLNELLKTRDFINCISDILSQTFSVRGESLEIFRNLIASNLNDKIKDFELDYGEDLVNQSRELLGVTEHKFSFWRAIFKLKEINFINTIDDSSIKTLLQGEFKIDFKAKSINYEDVTSAASLPHFKKLLKELKVSLNDFSKEYFYNCSLEKVHYKSLINSLLPRKENVKSFVWEKLSCASRENKKLFLKEINKFENNHEFLKAKSKELKWEFDIDLDTICHEFINSIYDDFKYKSDIEVSRKLEENQLEFNSEELNLINQSEELKSLIFFASEIEFIRNEITKDEKSIDDRKIKLSNDKISVYSSNLLKTKEKTKTKTKSVYTPSEKDNRRKKESGNIAEEIVYNHLNSAGRKNVYWASKDNEGLHYDIRYSDENGEIKYVEVKSFSGDKFIISNSEIEFGKKNKSNYEIWLIRKEKIVIVKDFFDNEKYNPIASEFEVFLEIEE